MRQVYGDLEDERNRQNSSIFVGNFGYHKYSRPITVTQTGINVLIKKIGRRKKICYGL